MKTKKTKYTLRNILKVISTMTDRAIPSDILEFLEEEYYSLSKKENIEYGDMDLTHLIRIYLKGEGHLKEARDKYFEAVEQVDKIKNLLEVNKK
jgi:exonuclease VII small subunit